MNELTEMERRVSDRMDSRDRQIEFMQSTLVALMGQIGELTQVLKSNNIPFPENTNLPHILDPSNNSVSSNNDNVPTPNTNTNSKEEQKKLDYNSSSSLPVLSRVSKSIGPPLTRYQKYQQQLKQKQNQMKNKNRRHPTKINQIYSSSSDNLIFSQSSKPTDDTITSNTHISTVKFKPKLGGTKQDRIEATKNKYANAWMPRVARLGTKYIAPPLEKKENEFKRDKLETIKDENNYIKSKNGKTKGKGRKWERRTGKNDEISTNYSTSSKVIAPLPELSNTSKSPKLPPVLSTPVSPSVDYHKIATKYNECRSTVFMPTEWEDPTAGERERVTTVPSMDLGLQYVYGNSGMNGGSAHFLGSGEIVYGIGMSMIVIENITTKKQRYFKEHDGETVTSMTIHPDGNIVASGQKGSILIWDSGAVIEGSSSMSMSSLKGSLKSNHILDQLHVLKHGVSDEEMFTVSTLNVIGNHNESFHNHLIISLDFSADGKLLFSMCNDPSHTIFVWNWKYSELITATKGGSSDIKGIKCNPFSYYGLPDFYKNDNNDSIDGGDVNNYHTSEDEYFTVFDTIRKPSPTPGQAPTIDQATYTFVTYGERHLKFWTLQTEDNSINDDNELVWKMEGQSPAPSRLVETNQIFTSIGFVDDSEPIRMGGTSSLPPWKGMSSRILVGTSRGDIYIYIQPRAPSKAQWIPWWEEQNQTSVIKLKFENYGRLLHCIPHNIKEGNKRLLSKEKLNELNYLTNLLTSSSNGRSHSRHKEQDEGGIKKEISDIIFNGSVGHNGSSITSIVCQHNDYTESYVITTSNDGTIKKWKITMTERPQFINVNGATESIPGIHNMIEINRLTSLSIYRDLSMLNKKEEKRLFFNRKNINSNDNNSNGGDGIDHITWCGRKLLLTTTKGSIVYMNADTFDGQIITERNTSTITDIKVHPSLPIFITTTNDGQIYLWRSDVNDDKWGQPCKREMNNKHRIWNRELITSLNVRKNITTIDFHPSRLQFCIGTKTGEVYLINICVGNDNGNHGNNETVEYKIKKQLITGRATNNEQIKLNVIMKTKLYKIKEDQNQYTLHNKKNNNRKSPIGGGRRKKSPGEKRDNKSSNNSPHRINGSNQSPQFPRRTSPTRVCGVDYNITVMKYSPDGKLLAIGSKCKNIYIYKCYSNIIKKMKILRGHSSSIIKLDWSVTSEYIQTNDIAKEILYWNVSHGKQEKKTMSMRNIQWYTWTCTYGWNVRGIWNNNDRTDYDIISLCRTKDCKYIVTSSDNHHRSSIQLHNFPSIPSPHKRIFKTYLGHCDPVVSIDCSTSYLFTTDGKTIMQWKLIHPTTKNEDGLESNEKENNEKENNEKDVVQTSIKRTAREEEYLKIKNSITRIAPSYVNSWPCKERVAKVKQHELIAEEKEGEEKNVKEMENENILIQIIVSTVADLVDAVDATERIEKQKMNVQKDKRLVSTTIQRTTRFDPAGSSTTKSTKTKELPPIDKTIGTFREKIFNNWGRSDNEAWLLSLMASMNNRNTLLNSSKNELCRALLYLTKLAPKITSIVKDCSTSTSNVTQFWTKFVEHFHLKVGIVEKDKKELKDVMNEDKVNQIVEEDIKVVGVVDMVKGLKNRKNETIIESTNISKKNMKEKADTNDFIINVLKQVFDQEDGLKSTKTSATTSNIEKGKEASSTSKTNDIIPLKKYPIKASPTMNNYKIHHHAAAVRIQSAQRGRRGKLRAARTRRNMKAATKIQACHRGSIGRRRRKPSSHHHAAATRIQAVHRGRVTRRKMKNQLLPTFMVKAERKQLHQRGGGGAPKIDPMLGHKKQSVQ